MYIIIIEKKSGYSGLLQKIKISPLEAKKLILKGEEVSSLSSQEKLFELIKLCPYFAIYWLGAAPTAQKINLSIKHFFSKYEQTAGNYEFGQIYWGNP